MIRQVLDSCFQTSGISNEEVFAVLEHLPTALAFVSADEEFNVLYVNRAFTRLFDYSKDDVKTITGWTELTYGDPTLRHQRLISWLASVEKAKIENSPIPDREGHVRSKDGTPRDVIIQTSLLRNVMLLAFTDITERKRLEKELRNTDKLFRGIVENANDIIYVLDLQGCFIYASSNIQSTLGWCPADLSGTDFRPLIHPQDMDRCQAAFASVITEGKRLTGIEYRIRKADGNWGWQYSNVGPRFDDSEHISGLICVGRDIDFRKKVEDQLYISEARYRLLSDHAHDVIWSINPNGIITYVSPSVELVRGYTPEEAMCQPLEQILTPGSIALNLAYFGEMLADVAAGRKPKPFRGQMEYICKDGSTYWCDVMATPILAEDGSLVELLGVSRDISEHKRNEAELKKAKEGTEALNLALEAANEQLNRIATTDPLTGLWNRRYFEDRASHEMSIAIRYNHPLSVLIFDIDHFKMVNDTHGHLVGDLVLGELSKQALQQIRATDLPCRWGGEEFVILMPNTNSEDAVAVAEKLRATFAVNQIKGVGAVTASFGVATFRVNESLDQWIGRADRALYTAKQSGRNAVKFAYAE